MNYPVKRMRRLRSDENIRRLVSETEVRPSNLIMPLFFDQTISSSRPIGSMPGIFAEPVSSVSKIADRMKDASISSVILFGIPSEKDSTGTGAYSKNGVVQQAIRGLKEVSNLLVISDLCMCEYTDHGQCGIVSDEHVDNDATLEHYAKIAVSQAEAGADIVAPSGMMDGQVASIRHALDDAGYDNVAIMSYSAKYCSSFYGPFRDAACSSPSGMDRSDHQMQCGNRREAASEMYLDVSEGADIIMVKPAMPYLDIISDARALFDVPIAAYQVSGEYAMIKAASERGWLAEEKAMMESLISIKRAGADMIISYFAEKAATLLRR